MLTGQYNGSFGESRPKGKFGRLPSNRLFKLMHKRDQFFNVSRCPLRKTLMLETVLTSSHHQALTVPVKELK